MVWLRFVLAFASPEFRATYGAQLARDMREHLAAHDGSRAHAWRMAADLAAAVAGERAGAAARRLTEAARSLARTPFVTSVIVVTLGLAIGANVAAFAIANGVLFHPLPFPHVERIVRVQRVAEIGGFHCTTCPVSAFSAFAYRDGTRTFRALAAFGRWNGVLGALRPGGVPRAVAGEIVGAQFFDVVGVRARLGRTFTVADERPAAPAVAVASDGFWRSALGADPALVGRTVFVDSTPVRLIGVLPPDFVFPSFSRANGERPQLYVVMTRAPGLVPGQNSYGLIGRLRDGVSRAAAQNDLMAVQRTLDKRYPYYRSDGVHLDTLNVVPLTEDLFGTLRPLLLLFAGAVLIVLLIACFNVANLLLARAVAGQRAVAVRLAIGATPRHVVLQIGAESIVLAAVSALLGLVTAHFALHAYVALSPPGMHRLDEIRIDDAVLAYAVLVTLAAAFLTCVFPAVAAMRSPLGALLATGERGARSVRHPLRSLLVIAQVGCAFTLVLACGLLVRSFLTLAATDVGYSTRGLVEVAGVPLNLARYSTIERIRAFYAGIEARLTAIPGVEHAAYSSTLPFDGNDSSSSFEIVGEHRKNTPDAGDAYVSPEFFATLGLRPLAGRAILARDGPASQPVAVVNQRLVREYFGARTAIGRRIRADLGRYGTRTIVGIVPTVQFVSLGEPPSAYMYFSAQQNYAKLGSYAEFLLRVRVPVASIAAPIAAAWRAADPELPPPVISTVDALIDRERAPTRATALLLAALAGLALVLAVSGTTSVVAYGVVRRTNEIGIRVALGARRRSIVLGVLADTGRMTLGGLALGLALAVPASRALADQLYATGPLDPPTYLAVAGVLALATFAGSFVPAYRAAQITPAVALRYE